MIEVRNLDKTFRLPHAKRRTLFHNLLAVATRGYDYETFFALRDVSFRVRKGEFVSIIGRNGSGKSTLLKILSRIYKPTRGEVIIRERLFPLLELGIGFQPEFSVRQNIYLYGALLGFSKTRMSLKVDEILEFAELTRFADVRFERLSTGMQMRLGFSIAIRSVAPIVIIDEVLAVGDQSFAEKCRMVFRDLKSGGYTILYVSHDLTSVLEYSDRVLRLDHGLLVDQGDPSEVVKRYSQSFRQPMEEESPRTYRNEADSILY